MYIDSSIYVDSSYVGVHFSKASNRKSVSHARAIGSVQKISRGNISNANANNRMRGNKKETENRNL